MRALNILYVNVAVYIFCSMLWKSPLICKCVLYLIKYFLSSNLYIKTYIIDIEVFSAFLTCFEVTFFSNFFWLKNFYFCECDLKKFWNKQMFNHFFIIIKLWWQVIAMQFNIFWKQRWLKTLRKSYKRFFYFQ